MGCELLEDRLSAFHDGELADPAEVEAHLEGCPDCRAALRELGAASSLLAVRRAFDPDPSFVVRFRQRLESLDAERAEWWRLLALRLMPLAATALIAALAFTAWEGGGAAEESFTTLERTVLAAGSPPLREADLDGMDGPTLLLSAAVDSRSASGLRRADLRWP